LKRCVTAKCKHTETFAYTVKKKITGRKKFEVAKWVHEKNMDGSSAGADLGGTPTKKGIVAINDDLEQTYSSEFVKSRD